MRKLTIILAFAALLVATAICGQTWPPVVAAQGVAPFYGVSTANTAQQAVFDLHNVHDTLAINAVCSAGTATLTVAAGIDGNIFLTLDSVTAASPQIKQYTATTVGAAIALSPLSFRYVQITVGTCGASNTSTLTVSAK